MTDASRNPPDLPHGTAGFLRDIEADASRLLLRFFYELDERRYDEMAGRFLPEGIWNRQGKALKGPAGIRQAMAERSLTVRTRHVITNILVTPSGVGAASFVLYLTAYSHDDGRGAPPPVRISRPALLLIVTGTLSAAAAGWRISEMTMNREFEFD